MPINIPNLNDRNYDQLYKEAMSVVTRYFPDYSGMSISDPAMAITELFSYYFDVTTYQLNRITPQTKRNFAALIGVPQTGYESPEELIRSALGELSGVKRAVTSEDIETMLKREIVAKPDKRAARVYLLPGQRQQVLLVAEKDALITDEDLNRIYILLRGCSPLGTRYQVSRVLRYSFDVTVEIVKKKDSTLSSNNLSKAVEDKLKGFFSPLTGGDSEDGWEFGRAISRSEIFSLIEQINDVDRVKLLAITKSGTAYAGDDELLLAQDELAQLDQIDITVL